jgi:spore coat protein U-like protein
MRRAWRLALGTFAAGLCAASLAAWAGVGTSTFAAVAFVRANCSVSTTPLAFGRYDPIGANRSRALEAQAAITVACVKGTAPTIALGPGSHSSGGARRMQRLEQGDYLGYELYKPGSNAAGAGCAFPSTDVWGALASGVFTATSAPSKLPRSYNVCGSVHAGQNPLVGTYADVVIATVNF